jgi:hypothetical protein
VLGLLGLVKDIADVVTIRLPFGVVSSGFSLSGC